MKRPKVSILLNGVFLVFFLSGCALQSSMVDVEDSSERIRKHQIQLQRRIEHLERELKSPSLVVKNQQSLSAELIDQLGRIETDVRQLSGQVAEADHKMSTLENKVDAESSRSKDLSDRRKALEARISALEGGKALKGGEGGGASGSRPAEAGQKPFGPRDAFNLAYNDYVKGDYNVAIMAFDSFIKEYPDSSLVPQAYYWKGESYYGSGSYQLAVDFFMKVVKEYPGTEKVSKSLLKTGFSYIELKKPQEGRRFLERVVAEFPSSNEAALARDALNSLTKSTR